MKRLWISAVMGMCALGLGAQEPNRTLRPQQATVQAVAREARIALVIGNAAYKDSPLRNPVNDARAMAAALEQCGFQVTKLENAGREAMFSALRQFGNRIMDGGVGLFYFAGHGMQVKGKNYLIPVGTDIASEDEVPAQALEVDLVLAKMESAKNRLNVLLLDACRNNPFGRSFRSGYSGLAQMDAPAGTYISFATAPGRTAADGAKANGLYTQHLLENLRTPGLKIEDVFKRVRSGVLQDSSRAQMPWDSSSLTGDFYFLPGVGTGSAGAEDHSTTGAGSTATIPAQDLLTKVLNARGGLVSLQSLRSLSLRGKKFAEGGPTGFKEDRAAGGLFRRESEFSAGLAVMVGNGSRIMMKILSRDGSQTRQAPSFLGDEEARMMNLAGSLLEDPMRLCAEGAGEAVSLPATQVENQRVLPLVIKLPSGAVFQYRVDPESFRPVGCQMRLPVGGTLVEITFRYRDFRKVGALWLPFQTEVFDPVRQTWSLSEELETLSLNPAFPKDHFRISDDTAAPGTTEMTYPEAPGPAPGTAAAPGAGPARSWRTDLAGLQMTILGLLNQDINKGKTPAVLLATWREIGQGLASAASQSEPADPDLTLLRQFVADRITQWQARVDGGRRTELRRSPTWAEAFVMVQVMAILRANIELDETALSAEAALAAWKDLQLRLDRAPRTPAARGRAYDVLRKRIADKLSYWMNRYAQEVAGPQTPRGES